MERCQYIDNYCYVCGKFVHKDVPRTQERHVKNLLTAEFKVLYVHYFNQPDMFDEDWTPNNVCRNCYNYLLAWSRSQRRNMPYLTPVIWTRDPAGHVPLNCYACHNYKVAISRSKNKIYQSTLTAAIPIPHDPEIEPPKPPSKEMMSESSATTSHQPSVDSELFDPSFEVESEDEPEFLTQDNMDYLIAKGRMSKKEAESVASYLKRKKLTDHVIATAYRKRQREYQPFFTNVTDPHEPYAYCNNVRGLFLAMKMEYIAEDWRLFVDGSSSSLKALLLHKSNRKPTVPLYYANNKKESRVSLSEVLTIINYDEHQWKLCADLKVVNLLCGAKGGNASYPCFKCDWNTRDKEHDQYTYTGYTNPNPEILSRKNGGNRVNLERVLIPPLHIKLGIVQKFLTLVFVKNDKAYQVLKAGLFKRRTETKAKGGTVNGPEIRKLMRNRQFENALTANQKRAWVAIKAVIRNVLGGKRAPPEEMKRCVDKMMTAMKKLKSTITYKMHLLNNHLDDFIKQSSKETEEHGEHVHCPPTYSSDRKPI